MHQRNLSSVNTKMHLLIISILSGLSYAIEDTEDACFNMLQDNEELSGTYPERIAHGIHSLTLSDVRYYFNPLANKTNNIPTVNMNLTSRVPILNDAPDLKRSDRFNTLALQVAENVILNNGENWEIHNADMLDKLLHALHMHEMWAAASKIYTSFLENPPLGAEVCSCLMDVENNGIYFHLRNIAILIREPELGYNKENLRVPRQGRARRREYTGSYSVGTYNGKKQLQSVLARKKRDAVEELFKHDKQYWIDLFEGFNTDMEDTHSDLALFLFCMLN